MLHGGSGIADDVIRARGYRSLDAPEAAATLPALGFSPEQCRLGAGLLFPLTLPDDPAPLYQFRPDHPRTGDQGKSIKYEIPAGACQRLIFHPHASPMLGEDTAPLWITEGAKKLDALIARGVPAVGLIGVYSFANKRTADEKMQRAPKRLLPDWQHTQLQGRQVGIVFDSDAATNTQVQRAERELAELLSAEGALVSIARLPPDAEGAKQGVDDFFAHGHPLQELEALARPYATASTIVAWLDATPTAGRLPLLVTAMEALSTMDPLDWMLLKPELKARIPALNMNDIERAWTQRHKTHLRTLARTGRLEGQTPTQDQIASELAERWQGTTVYDLGAQEWMLYQDGRFTRVDSISIEQRIAAYMDAEAPGYTGTTLTGVLRLVRAKVATTLPLETPGWLPFTNGALDLATGFFHPHSPSRPFVWQLPYAYTSGASCPKTQAWLLEAVGGDPLQVQLLRAFIKAVVTRRVDLQRYLENIGPGGTGKGTYMRLLHAIVGHENTFVTELKHLETNRFETSGLRHKLLMLVTDAERYSGPVNQLKAITGQDTIRMEQKFKQGGSAYAPVMVCIAANEPIQSADYTSGLTRRRIALTFCHKPAQARNLLEWKNGAWVGELAAEIPGVLHWAMQMPDAEVYRLLKETDTAVPQLAWLAKKTMIETNPLADWANTNLIHDDRRDPEGTPLVRTNVGIARRAAHSDRYECEDTWLYPNYRAWAEGTGNKAVSMRRFATTLHDLLVSQMGLPVEYRQDWTGAHFKGIRMRRSRDADEPLICPPESASLKVPMDAQMDQTRATDGSDGFYGLSRDPVIDHPPTYPVERSSEAGRVGGSIERNGIPDNPSASIGSISGAGLSHPPSPRNPLDDPPEGDESQDNAEHAPVQSTLYEDSNWPFAYGQD
jgi:phage/plasmid-associated DNA primase